MILTGCSGWSYSDWVDRFYPRELAQKHSEWLPYYAGFFETTEVNSTFYSLPPRRVVDAWTTRTRDIDRFEFSVKMPKSITHDRLPAGDIEGASRDYGEFRANCIDPLRDAGRLGAVLIQLPPQLSFSDANMGLLKECFERMAGGGLQFAVEFRHRSWVGSGTAELRDEAAELLTSVGFISVIVDSPAFPAMAPSGRGHAYIRFHGRNSDIWYEGAGEDDMRINRYDYLYSRGELGEWVPHIRAIDSGAGVTRIYFNNHGRAKAAKNALELMDLLGIEHSAKDIRIMDQSRLGSFVD